MLNNIIKFLNYNSGAMTAIFTAMIAVFTALYVIGTLLMWNEMRKSRLKLDQSNIQISFEPQKRWGNFFDLVIKNLGNTPVFDLKLKIEPTNLITLGDRKLEDLNIFKKQIPVFGVGEELRTFAITYISFIESNQPKQFSITAEYKNSHKKIISQKYDFDMEVYKGMSARTDKSLNEVVAELEKLNSSLDKITK